MRLRDRGLGQASAGGDRRDVRHSARRLGDDVPAEQRDDRAGGPGIRRQRRRSWRTSNARGWNSSSTSTSSAKTGASTRATTSRARWPTARSTASRFRRSSCCPTSPCSSSPATKPRATPPPAASTRSSAIPTNGNACKRDPSLAPKAAEEIVRWTSPVIQFTRIATADTVIRGQQLQPGRHHSRCSIPRPPATRMSSSSRPRSTSGAIPIRISPSASASISASGANLARLELQVMFRATGGADGIRRAGGAHAADAFEFRRRHQAHADSLPDSRALNPHGDGRREVRRLR